MFNRHDNWLQWALQKAKLRKHGTLNKVEVYLNALHWENVHPEIHTHIPWYFFLSSVDNTPNIPKTCCWVRCFPIFPWTLPTNCDPLSATQMHKQQYKETKIGALHISRSPEQAEDLKWVFWDWAAARSQPPSCINNCKDHRRQQVEAGKGGGGRLKVRKKELALILKYTVSC